MGLLKKALDNWFGETPGIPCKACGRNIPESMFSHTQKFCPGFCTVSCECHYKAVVAGKCKPMSYLREHLPKKDSEANTVYQIVANSNAAPFVSDTAQYFIEASNPNAALKKAIKQYNHPAGLYALGVYEVSVENKLLKKYLSPKAKKGIK